MHQTHDQPRLHLPVLLEPVLAYLAPQPGDSYLDLTAGYGGHAEQILKRTDSPQQAVLVDRDERAISELAAKFADRGVEILHKDFLAASRELAGQGRQFDIILADLGLSSPHLNEASRGFAITAMGPLDMRMDQRQELTAETVVNRYSEDQLADLLSRYGEEPKARRIARLLTEHRPLHTTTELAKIAAMAWGGAGHSKVHPATRTFQAIRIAVNDELRQIADSLPLWIDLLKPGGRLAVISFHSLEDRLVKQAFAEAGGAGYDARLTLLTKHPITAEAEEIAFNPRARSAKLRVAQRK